MLQRRAVRAVAAPLDLQHTMVERAAFAMHVPRSAMRAGTGRIIVRDSRTGEVVADGKLGDDMNPVHVFAISPDGTTIAT